MVTKFTYEDFDKKVLAGYPKDARDTIAGAVRLGWELHVTSRNSLTIVAPNGVKKYHFSIVKRGGYPIARIRRDIIKYGDAVRLALLDAAVQTDIQTSSFDIEALMERPEDMAKRQRRQPRTTGRTDEQAAKKAVAIPTPAQVEERVKAERHVVSEAPYLSHYQIGSETTPGRSYPSESIIERKWSDGTVDFKCRLCDFTSDKMQGVRAHWQIHVRSGEVKKWTEDNARNNLVEDPSYTEHAYSRRYTPRKERVEALATWLLDQFTLDGSSGAEPTALAKALARGALEWVHEQSNQGSSMAAEAEPLTAEQILQRIRRLVDQGEYLEQAEGIAERDQRILELEAQVAEAHARAERVSATLRAFTDLASELRQDVDGETETNEES